MLVFFYKIMPMSDHIPIPVVGRKQYLFGKPSAFDTAQLVVLPVPYALTVSDRTGTNLAPKAIADVSTQIDYGMFGVTAPWNLQVHLLPTVWENRHLQPEALQAYYRDIEADTPAVEDKYAKVLTLACAQSAILVRFVRRQVHALLQQDKVPILLGGEHSVSLGAIQALNAQYPKLGVLQIDAHMDLHPTYAGMTHTHACVMHQVLQTTRASITQVGIRAFAPDEAEVAQVYADRLSIFYQGALDQARFTGTPWQTSCDAIIATLPEQVYLTLDIDGLALSTSFSTGTPVPNGLSYGALCYLLRQLVVQGRKIVGLDLVEVVPTADGTAQRVAANLLYHLCVWAACSRKYVAWA